MKQGRGFLLVLPAFLVLMVFFVAPLLNGLWISVHRARFGIVLPGLTAANYASLFTNPNYLDALFRTLELSSLATLLALILGYPIAYAIAFRLRKAAGLVTLLLIAPLLMNVVIRTLGWVLILGRNGLVNDVLARFGIGEHTLLYTPAAVLIGYVQVFLPFMVLSILASLQTIDLNLMKASHSLGCTPFKTFWKILVPLSLPGVLSGCTIVFSLASGVFVLPVVLGGVGVQVLSLLAYRQTFTSLNYPLGAAVAFLLLFIVATLTFLATFLLETSRYREVFRRASV